MPREQRQRLDHPLSLPNRRGDGQGPARRFRGGLRPPQAERVLGHRSAYDRLPPAEAGLPGQFDAPFQQLKGFVVPSFVERQVAEQAERLGLDPLVAAGARQALLDEGARLLPLSQAIRVDRKAEEHDPHAGLVADSLELVHGTPVPAHALLEVASDVPAAADRAEDKPLQQWRKAGGTLEQLREVPPALQRAVRRPVVLQQDRDPQPQLGVRLARPLQGGADVVLLRDHQLVPLLPLGLVVEVGRLRERADVLGVPAPQLLSLP